MPARFDYAGDAWGYTYGAAAEWYQGPWTLRGGDFRSVGDARRRGRTAPTATGSIRPSASFRWSARSERHELWGQPGKIKVTGFLTDGRVGQFSRRRRALPASLADASDALAAVRSYAAGRA